jgi:hypothetical protein
MKKLFTIKIGILEQSGLIEITKEKIHKICYKRITLNIIIFLKDSKQRILFIKLLYQMKK